VGILLFLWGTDHNKLLLNLGMTPLEEVEKGFEKYVEKKKIQPDAQGRYYDRGYGDYITPAIWAAIISNQINRTQASQPRTNVRPGCVSSCACVSCACACACACAGGGAAGCSRKSLHECRACANETIENCETNISKTP